MPTLQHSKGQKSARTKKVKKITKDMLVGDLIERHPEAVPVLLEHGLHCIGCMVSPYESLEAGAAVHGIPIEPLLSAVNAVVLHQHKKQ